MAGPRRSPPGQRACSSRLLAAWALVFFAFATDVAASVDVHFESKDGGFFLKQGPRQFYMTVPRADLGPNAGGSTTSSSASSSSSSSSSSTTSSASQGSSILSVDKFTVFQTSEPVSVRATYGPFSTKQTVPARYIVPDPLDTLPSLDPKKINGTISSAMLLEVQELGARHLDMSAHIVSPVVPRDSPVLRVLFHAGSEATGRRQLLLGRHQRVCVLLHATPSPQPSSGRAGEHGATDALQPGPLTASCSPDGQDGVCLAQITIPASWWPPLPPPDSAGRVKPTKTLPRVVQLAYSVLEPRGTDEPSGQSAPSSGGHGAAADSAAYCQPKVQIQPVTPLGQVTLGPNRATYKELKTDEYLTLLVPHGPLYPRSRLHIPVFLQSHSSKQTGQGRAPIAAVVLRAKVKAGVKILDASSSSPDWIVESDVNTKNTAATFTARRKENVSRLPNASAEEIMTMLLEASDESADSKEHGGGRIVWSVRYALEGEEDNVSLAGPYQAQQPQAQQTQPQQQHYHHHHHGSERKKLQAHLEIQKDDIQAVLPISKNWEVMNTAVLTGKQISQAMKVFIVSQAGTVADVTLQSSCHSEDESVLKVSSSCSSVYVDGSEIRGSSNASVLVKYGTYTGLARFTVWMPEFPLEVSVPDSRLNQIKGWKVPEEQGLAKNKRSPGRQANAIPPGTRDRRAATTDKDDEIDYEEEDPDEEEEEDEPEEEDDDPEEGAQVDGEDGEDLDSGKMRFRSADKWDEINSIDRTPSSGNCRLRFQQSPVEVHARFLAADHDSGRVSYFVNRRTWLRITDLVSGLLRVSDPRIASLQHGIVQGRGIGRTEVQVLSPITGRVLGAEEVRVSNDRVSISQLSVKVVSGLQLSISPDSAIENGYVAEASVTRKLTAQYQEGLLDIDIEFSDGSRTPLRDIAVSDYQLVVENLDPEVVAFAPMVASHHPRVIAVGEGRGDLLRVSLQLADSCRLQAGRRPGSKAPAQRAQAAGASSAATSSAAAASSAPQAPALPLATATANVEVDFAASEMPSRPEFVQNDGGGGAGASLGIGAHSRERKAGREVNSDLHDILRGMGGSGVRHINGPHMTPLEIGMYVLLAAFCFAIVVFVVSCVVFASKFKPLPDSEAAAMGSGLGAGLPVLGAARAAASQFGQNRNRPRESTTNAHDWVWLGRATLERACAPQQVRVTSNPLAVEAEDETLDLGTSFDNPNHLELPSSGLRSTGEVSGAGSITSSSQPGHIDSTTYCKRDRTPRSFAKPTAHSRNDNENSPPPLPPHKMPMSAAAAAAAADNGNEDYKPPVPPHRNTTALGITRLPETPKRRHHHHQRANSSGEHVVNRSRAHEATPSKHHHHRASKSSRSKSSNSNNSNASPMKSKPDSAKEQPSNNADLAFVEVRNRDPDSARSRRARSREIKRATVVGNPMFSSSSSNSSGSPTHAEQLQQLLDEPQQQQQNATGATTSSTGLDDLNLGMDYNQIMQYFDNLKESNA